MRPGARTILTAALLAGCLSVAGCGGAEQGATTVQMKDMEVVDGTATDAMTDLDGVQSEGTAVALPADNSGANISAARPAKPAQSPKPPGDDAEVLADQ